MVLISPPPPLIRPTNPQYISLNPGDKIMRIYNPERHNTKEYTFRDFGPLFRFDHHRPLAVKELEKEKGAIDKERRSSYWGFTLSCCLVEKFGDTKIIEFKSYKLAILILTESLELLDLRNSGAMAAGSVYALSSETDRKLSQAWSNYIYEQTNIYGEVDGLMYHNAHNGENAIVLYERCEAKIKSSKIKSKYLKNRSLRHLIDQCATNHSMACFEPY